MGTSGESAAAGPEPRHERIAKLRARKKDLETLLQAKNDLLRRLCAKEQALAEPPPPSHRQIHHQLNPRNQTLVHRLSTPASNSSAGPPPPPPPPPPPLSTHRSTETLPSAASPRRHRTVTTEMVSETFYSSKTADSRRVTRLQETHFSSSHPDIAMRHAHSSYVSHERQQPVDTLPLLYQYASQLKSRNPHTSGLPRVAPAHPKKREPSRRNALQRTQTYHLTSYSDYNTHLESMPRLTPQPTATMTTTTTHRHPPSVDRNYNAPRSGRPAQPSPQNVIPVLRQATSYVDGLSGDPQDQRAKEKEWYESSLDSPNLSRESYGSLKRPSQPRESPDGNFNPVLDSRSAFASPTGSQGALSPRSQTSADVPFESPKNCTVVESGKWIPYREVSKPFEMSDFYKYSTKFRQSNNNANHQKPRMPSVVACDPMSNVVHMQPEDSKPFPPRELWKHPHQL